MMTLPATGAIQNSLVWTVETYMGFLEVPDWEDDLRAAASSRSTKVKSVGKVKVKAKVKRTAELPVGDSGETAATPALPPKAVLSGTFAPKPKPIPAEQPESRPKPKKPKKNKQREAKHQAAAAAGAAACTAVDATAKSTAKPAAAPDARRMDAVVPPANTPRFPGTLPRSMKEKPAAAAVAGGRVEKKRLTKTEKKRLRAAGIVVESKATAVAQPTKAPATKVPQSSGQGGAFVAAAKFEGAREGYAFKKGDVGLGYYREEADGSGKSAKRRKRKLEQLAPDSHEPIASDKTATVRARFPPFFSYEAGVPE